MSGAEATNEPDERVVEAGRSCSLWWSRTPRLDGRRTGFIGHWSEGDPAAGKALLEVAKRRLRAAGCEVAVGPIHGTTWHPYRVVVEDSGEPPFPFEPTLRDDGSFAAAGFRPLATYRSVVVEPRAGPTAPPSGIRIRPFRLDEAERDLAAFHAIATEAFCDAFLYAPIDLDAFLALYRPVLQRVDADLVLVAEQAGRPVGFVFALPEPGGRRVVLKTVAVLDRVRGHGVGSALMGTVEARAHDRGFREAVHALAHEDNDSLRFSRGRGRIVRRYAVVGCELGARDDRGASHTAGWHGDPAGSELRT